MRRLTRDRMDRNGRGVGASALSHLGRGLLVAVGATAPAALVGSVSCASDPPGIAIAEGGGGTGEIVDPGSVEEARCGEDGIKCGTSCCLAGNSCQEDRCIPAIECTTSGDCLSDSQCAAGSCQPWNLQPVDRRADQSCRTSINLPDVVPTVQCQWPGNRVPAELPNSVQVIGTPMVVDFNSDGDPTTSHPSIVFVSYEGSFQEATGVLRVIDGEDCSLQATIQGQFGFTPEVPVALGDINGDGSPDIVAADEEQLQAAVVSGIAAFGLSGTGPTPTFSEIGRIRSGGTGIIKGFALHDIDNDEFPEIFTEKTMLRFDRELGLTDVSALQQPNRPELTALEPPTVMDLDGDLTAEVITPQGIFTWDTLATTFKDKTTSLSGSDVLWDNEDDFAGTFMGMANLGDWPTNLPSAVDSAELLVIGPGGEIQLKTINGTTRFRMGTLGLAGGPPVIADVDGDGRMEFASGGLDRLTVFDLDCTPQFFNQRGCEGGRGAERASGVLWESAARSRQSGLAVFDFNGDGRTELVHADKCFMRVYDGMTGEVLFSTPRSSTTQYEYPVVADVDGDRFSEIVTASNDNDPLLNCEETDVLNKNAVVNFEPTHGVTVWQEAEDRWAGSRPIWNQHNYFVTNVNDDGTIPRMAEVQSPWDGGPNTFRQNVQGATGQSLSLADVTTAGEPTVVCRPDRGLATLTVGVCNRGVEPLAVDRASIALVDDARPTTVLCQQRNLRAIGSGSCIEMACDIPVTPGADPIDVRIMGDPTDEVKECYEANNVSFIQRVSCAPGVPR